MLCAAPFAGPAAPVMRAIGKRPSDKNPTMCTSCFDFMAKHHGGAEIECSFLFADVRGSTSIAERMSPTEFRGLLDRFYALATTLVIDHDGSIDKFVGDELVAMFFPLLSGVRHAERAIAAARRFSRRPGTADPDGPGCRWGPACTRALHGSARSVPARAPT